MLYDCDDGVLLLRRETVITQMLPYNPYFKERGEGCKCYMIATTAYYCYVENSHNTDVALYSYTNLKERGEGCRCYMIATMAYF